MLSSKSKLFLENIIPPFIANSYKKRRSLVRADGLTLKKWRSSTLMRDPRFKNDYPELILMVEDYLASKDFDDTSKYWKHLVNIHLKDLSSLGVDRYGEKVARHYASWADFNDSKLQNLIEDFGNYQEQSLTDIFKIHAGFSPSSSIKHNVLIELLLRRIVNNGLFSQLEGIPEKDFVFGNHPSFSYKGREINLDLLCSLLELQSIKESLKDAESGAVLEIGAGSGRIANIFMRSYPNEKYVIADIPPALFISATRLRLAFPNKKIVFVSNKIDLQKILSNRDWDVIACKPSLLEYFPDKFFKLTIAIDCLHEMNNKQRRFVSGIAEVKSQFFYLKVWNQTFIPLDNINLRIENSLEDYYVKESWHEIFNRSCLFPGDYTEICYKMPTN
jgi:putative sugar O-methyltransferase